MRYIVTARMSIISEIEPLSYGTAGLSMLFENFLDPAPVTGNNAVHSETRETATLLPYK